MKKIFNFLHNRFIELIIIFVSSLTPLLWLSDGKIIIGHDSGVRIDYLNNLFSYLYSWDFIHNFGRDWSLYKGFLINQLPETLLSVLFGSNEFGQKFSLIFWFLLIELSIFLSLSYIFRNNKYRFFVVFSTLFYSFNFYLLQGWTIFERAKFSLYLALPIIITVIWSVFNYKFNILKGSAIIAFIFLFFNAGGSPPLYAASILTFGTSLLVMLFINLVNKKFNTIYYFVKFVLATTLLSILVNSYWLLPQSELFSSNYQKAVLNQGGVEGLINWEQVISKNASFTNILRMQGIPDWYNNPNHPFSNIYLNNIFFISLSYIPFIVIILGIIKFGFSNLDKKLRYFLYIISILFLISIPAVAGSHFPFGNLYLYLMRHMPGFAIFRSSFYKFAPAFILSFTILFSYYLNLFIQSINKIKFKKISYLIIILLFGVYNYPFFVVNFFQFSNIFSTKLKVPDYINKTLNEITEKSNINSRILLLPELDNGIINLPIDTYKWGFYGLDILPRIGLNRSIVANDNNGDYIVKLIYKSLYEKQENNFYKLLQLANINSILLRKDVYQTETALKKGTPGEIENILQSFRNIKKVIVNNEWSYFEVELQKNYLVYSNNNYLSDWSSSDKSIEIVLNDKYKNFIVKSFYNDKGENNILLGQAECYLCKENEFNKTVESILPIHPKVQIINKLYNFLVVKKEEDIVNSITKSNELIDYYLANNQKMIGEILTLNNKNKSFSQISEKYNDQLTKILENFVKLTDVRLINLYSIRISEYLTANLRDLNSETTEIVSLKEFINNKLSYFKSKIIATDKNHFVYGINIPREGYYRIWHSENNIFGNVIEVNNQIIGNNSVIYLKSGYVFVIISKINPDDFVSDQELFFVNDSIQSIISNLSSISYKIVNPTLVRVNINNTNESFNLIMLNSYDSRWKAYIIDGEIKNSNLSDNIYFNIFPKELGLIFNNKSLSEENHFKVNNFANGWKINKQGNFTVLLFYEPQKLFYIGLILSFVGIFICIFILKLKDRKVNEKV